MALSARVALISLLLFPISFLCKAETSSCIFKVPAAESANDRRHDYPMVLLKKILEATESKEDACQIQTVGSFNQRRSIAELEKPDGKLDIAWLPANDNINKRLQAVPVPIRKGLLGWRVLLIRREDLNTFAKVQSLADLKQFALGYGATWQDLPVMQANFSRVITSTDYESLFMMLEKKRFDFMSRALHEAWNEMENRQELGTNLTVEPTLALHYKEADFFYVGKHNTALYERLARGLNKLLVSGAFDKLFHEYHSKDILRARMHTRRVIDLDNHYLPPNVPIEAPELWFQLHDIPKLNELKNRKM